MPTQDAIRSQIETWLPVGDAALQWTATILNRPIQAPPVTTTIAQEAAREAVWPAAGVILILGIGALIVFGRR